MTRVGEDWQGGGGEGALHTLLICTPTFLSAPIHQGLDGCHVRAAVFIKLWGRKERLSGERSDTPEGKDAGSLRICHNVFCTFNWEKGHHITCCAAKRGCERVQMGEAREGITIRVPGRLGIPAFGGWGPWIVVSHPVGCTALIAAHYFCQEIVYSSDNYTVQQKQRNKHASGMRHCIPKKGGA